MLISLLDDCHLNGKEPGTKKAEDACVIIGAWQVARDRSNPENLLAEALPAKHHLNLLSGTHADGLLLELDEAVQNNLQGHATAFT